ncbi:MAG: VanW family protein, partial [Defluviitaleaceae bacterium]|nr:VanW family protein [Defluviitaleaceae bacterium]
MKHSFLLFLVAFGLCGCNMQAASYRATDVVDLGRIEDDGRLAGAETAAPPSPAPAPTLTPVSTPAPAPVQVKLSEFSTEISEGDAAREGNIKLSSSTINGTVIKPGEVFSFNEAVGPTKKETGFRLARIFIKGRDAKGYGGGVCQV